MAGPLRGSIPAAAAVLLILAAGWGLRGCLKAGQAPPAAETGLSLPILLGDSADGFRKVERPRPLRFPADHGPHPEFRSEWWYFTGNLRDSAGREFGYQLTFFRSGLVPPGPRPSGPGPAGAGMPRSSPWAADHAYMAHFALTEIPAGRFRARERFSRAALGLAGAEAAPGHPFRVWLEDWSCVSIRDSAVPSAGDTGIFPLRLRASQGGVAIDLILGYGKPLVLQGDRGYSRKGPQAGNASYYYSYTRMPSSGQVTTPDGTFTASGSSWMDREWGSSLLTPGLAGWEWFGLRLADSTEYLFFRLRKSGAAAAREAAAAFDYGIRVAADGGTTRFDPADMEARILSRWTGRGGRTYPARWRIQVPSDSLDMEVEPALADQELDLSIPYWEGAVHVRARKGGRPVSGEGYMELTGY